MAHRKAGGTAKNLRDSNPKYLGVKITDGQSAKTGQVIVRQRGTAVLAGKNVGVGNDYTLFALINGTVQFREARKKSYDGSTKKRKVVDVISG